MAAASRLAKRPREDSASSSAEGQPIVALHMATSSPQLRDTSDYPRRRATIACEICRSRKSRCDGGRPKCHLCVELNAECVYREPGLKLDAGDKLILEQLGRIEGLLHARLSAPTAAIPTSSPSAIPVNMLTPGYTRNDSGEEEIRGEESVVTPGREFDGNQFNGLGTWSTEKISTMPKGHGTPAVNLLQWPKIRDLVTRASDPRAVLELEMSRPPLVLPQTPRPDLANAWQWVGPFFDRVNVWFAFVNPYALRSYYRIAVSNSFAQGPESCLVMLVFALGSAASRGSIAHQQVGMDPPGLEYFAAASKLLPEVMLKNDMLAVKCHTLAAAYLMYLVRPLEAWNMLANAAFKLQLLLSAPERFPPQYKQLSERLYWNTLLVESDLLAEMELPNSGISNFEDVVKIPGPFRDTGEDSAGKDELWYFLAEISLRQLLNRVSNTIYTKQYLNPPTKKLERLVTELDYQLATWYRELPDIVKFPKSRLPTDSPIQTVLRLRYFACRTIIFRPYVLAVLANEAAANDPVVLENCEKCLEACVRQIEHMAAHHTAHIPYLWQGALGIVSQTLLTMGASLVPVLAAMLPPPQNLSAIIAGVLTDLEGLSHLAPSIKLGFNVVQEAEERRQMFLNMHPKSGSVERR